ncbi:hypothetical protein AMECASPLE_036385 [Ameca splendens]|uniref:Uncharacterized protein n=1 Tax=Ameca splendens TaxID=208324 RepID=A0ABV0YUR6_9TELE
MFGVRVRCWMEVLCCVNPTKSLLQFPGTCKPKGSTNHFSRLPTSSSSPCPPSTQHHLENNQREYQPLHNYLLCQPQSLWYYSPPPGNITSTITCADQQKRDPPR